MATETGSSFGFLIERLKRGETEAAAQFWEQYGPYVRRLVRIQLARLDLDNRDFSESRAQSVAAKFLDRWQDGKLDDILVDIHRPAQLLGLLREITHGNLVDWVRRQMAACRDASLNVPWDDHTAVVVPSPSKRASDQDDLERLRSLMSVDEWEIDQLYRLGFSWQEISKKLRGERRPDALRKLHARAIARVREAIQQDE